MLSVIGEVLPSAVGVAISPVPIIAVILVLLAPRAGGPAVSFLLGWVCGVTLVVGAVTLLTGPTDTSETSDPSATSSMIKLLIGALLLALAVRSWARRSPAGEDPKLPTWMAAIQDASAAKAFGLAFLLSSINPKNLALSIAGGTAIGATAENAAQGVVGVIAFVVIASASVAVPVLGFLVAQDKMRRPLDELREWLTVHNSAVMSVLLLVLGMNLMGKGMAGF